jgi:hypothetical protein
MRNNARSRTPVSAGVRAYYFDLAGDAVLDRFERYRKKVEEHLANADKNKGASAGTELCDAFVLNDYGECCRSYYERTWDAPGAGTQ